MFRELLRRESLELAWRDLLIVYRRMELRGDVRGGRFVTGVLGEQFALPQAVDALRAVRRQGSTIPTMALSAADPLNLLGILLPGERVPATACRPVRLINGVPIGDAGLSNRTGSP